MEKLCILSSLVGAISLSGCQTFDAYTGEEKVSNTAKGAGIGAGIGAVLAYVANRDESSKKRKKRMLQAAGIGAIAGGGVGATPYNQALSERRANSVAQYLLSKNIVPVRIETIGFGEDAPIADNASDEGRSLSRRVELSLLPITEES
jgi:hypothetical protein